MIETIDHKILAKSRIITEYRESNLVDYILGLLTEANNLEEVFQDILRKRYIETAEGAQLDIIGQIVGQSRNIIDGAFAKFFGFSANPSGSGFNTVDFWDGSEPPTVTSFLSDEEYRKYIIAKIYTNHSESTHEDFVKVFKALFGADTKVMTIDAGSAYAQVFLGGTLSAEDELLIKSADVNKILPRPGGVRIEYFKWAGGGPFAFAANPLAIGFNNGGFFKPIGEV